MTQSLQDDGQVSPIIGCLLEGQMVLVDGFKRLHAARSLKGFTHLSARLLGVDEQAAKASVFNLNRIVGGPVELEESWTIYALVREDGLQQIEVAAMLGRHKSRLTSCSRSLAKRCANQPTRKARTPIARSQSMRDGASTVAFGAAAAATHWTYGQPTASSRSTRPPRRSRAG